MGEILLKLKFETDDRYREQIMPQTNGNCVVYESSIYIMTFLNKLQ